MAEPIHHKIGFALEKEKAKKIVFDFRERFMKSGGTINWKGKKTPGWTELKDSFQIQKTDKKIFREDIFFDENYYVYFEFANSIYLSEINNIRKYFDEKPLWVQLDTYIFPATMRWCVFTTHDDDLFLVTEG